MLGALHGQSIGLGLVGWARETAHIAGMKYQIKRFALLLTGDFPSEMQSTQWVVAGGCLVRYRKAMHVSKAAIWTNTLRTPCPALLGGRAIAPVWKQSDLISLDQLTTIKDENDAFLNYKHH